MENLNAAVLAAFFAMVIVFVAGIQLVRPTMRGLTERWGKYHGYAEPGYHWIIPLLERLYLIPITEIEVTVDRQEVVTSDNMNLSVAASVYFQVRCDAQSVRNYRDNVFDNRYQIVNLAQMSLCKIFETKTRESAQRERGIINSAFYKRLVAGTTRWGITIVRTELTEIDPLTVLGATSDPEKGDSHPLRGQFTGKVRAEIAGF